MLTDIRRVLVLVLLLGLVAVPSARAESMLQDSAEPVTVSGNLAATDPVIASYVTIARIHFGAALPADRCPAGAEVYLASNFGSTYFGAADQGGCAMWLTSWFWPSPPVSWTLPRWRAEVCWTVVHEYGHLLGLDHVDVPGAVMNASDPAVMSESIGCPAYPGARRALDEVEIDDNASEGDALVLDLELGPEVSRPKAKPACKRSRRARARKVATCVRGGRVIASRGWYPKLDTMEVKR